MCLEEKHSSRRKGTNLFASREGENPSTKDVNLRRRLLYVVTLYSMVPTRSFTIEGEKKNTRELPTDLSYTSGQKSGLYWPATKNKIASYFIRKKKEFVKRGEENQWGGSLRQMYKFHQNRPKGGNRRPLPTEGQME